MDINEAHRKFGHAMEKVVQKQLQELDLTPTGQMSVCDGRARAKATQKPTKRLRQWLQTSRESAFTWTPAARIRKLWLVLVSGSSLSMTKLESHGTTMVHARI